jgi:hypothetical protein
LLFWPEFLKFHPALVSRCYRTRRVLSSTLQCSLQKSAKLADGAYITSPNRRLLQILDRL